MAAPRKAGVILAVSFIALAAGGCAALGGGKQGSIAADRAVAATPATVSFTQADLDGDARITRQEFELWMRRYGGGAPGAQAAAGGTVNPDDAFDSADTNFNGVLTLDEWQAMTANPSSTAAGAFRAPKPKPSR